MSSKFAKERRRKAVSHISVQDLPHDTSNDGHGSSTPMDFIPSQFVSSSIDLLYYHLDSFETALVDKFSLR
jgi:hypothetical protein